MQVNVFVSQPQQDGKTNQMLILPSGPEAVIPGHLRHLEWRYFATTEHSDALLGSPSGEVQVAIGRDGYMITTPQLVTTRR